MPIKKGQIHGLGFTPLNCDYFRTSVKFQESDIFVFVGVINSFVKQNSGSLSGKFNRFYRFDEFTVSEIKAELSFIGKIRTIDFCFSPLPSKIMLVNLSCFKNACSFEETARFYISRS